MKIYKVLIGVALVLFATVLMAPAQGIGGNSGTYLWQTDLLPSKVLTNTMSATGNTNLLNVGSSTQLLLQLTVRDHVANHASNVTVTAYKSIDGSKYEAAAAFAFSIPATGTTYATAVTNFDVSGIQQLKFVTSTTAVPAGPITNAFLLYTLK